MVGDCAFETVQVTISEPTEVDASFGTVTALTLSNALLP